MNSHRNFHTGRGPARGCDMWDAFSAAVTGDAAALRSLLDRDPNLYRAGYWYTPPIYFAVREGQLEAVRVLLDAGSDPAAVGLTGEDLITVARDRGYEEVACLLEDVRDRSDRSTRIDTTPVDHAIHAAAAAGDWVVCVRCSMPSQSLSIAVTVRGARRCIVQ